MPETNVICRMRDITFAMLQLEQKLTTATGITLREAMVLCTLESEGRQRTASDIALCTGLRGPSASKVLRILEKKDYIQRSLGATDKRNMWFQLTPTGYNVLVETKRLPLDIPAILLPLFDS